MQSLKMLDKKIAIVTGSNKGIGYAIVKGLCQKFNGDVFLTSRDIERGKNAVESLNKLGLNPKYHQLDITNNESIILFRDFIKKEYGGIDILINNAAIAYPDYEKTSELLPELLERIFKYLNFADVNRASRVCRKWKDESGRLIRHRSSTFLFLKEKDQESLHSLLAVYRSNITRIYCIDVSLFFFMEFSKHMNYGNFPSLTMIYLRNVGTANNPISLKLLIKFLEVKRVQYFEKPNPQDSVDLILWNVATCLQFQYERIFTGFLDLDCTLYRSAEFSELEYSLFGDAYGSLFVNPMQCKEPFSVQAKETLRVNYFALRNLCDNLFPLLRSHSRVVNVSSSAGHLSRIPGEHLRKQLSSPTLTEKELDDLMTSFINDTENNTYESKGWPSSAYSVSKVGVSALTIIQQRNILNDSSRSDIVINSVHPGYVDTDMTSHKGPLTIEQGAEAPLYAALLPENIEKPKGSYIWVDKQIVDWANGPLPSPY